MASPYARSRSGGGSAYAQRRNSGGSAYSQARDGSGSSAPAPKHHRGGLLGTIEHVITQTPKDLVNTALQAPGGIVKLAKVIPPDLIAIAEGAPQTDKRRVAANDLGKGILHQTIETVKHPLRNPGNTLLLGLPAVGAAGKLAEAGDVARAGATAGEVARVAVKGAPGTRTLKVGNLEVRGHYSRSAGSRVVQKLTDAGLQRGAEKSVKVENKLHKRAAKWNQRNERVADSTQRAAGTRVAILGQTLKPDELRALRLVAEETPVARRLGAQEMRKGRATNPKEQARHQERIDLTKGAMKYLDEHPTTGAPVFKPAATKLAKVYDALKTASSDREAILKNLDLLDESAQQAAKTKTARIAAGATVNKKTGEVVGAEDIVASPNAVHIGAPVERTKVLGRPKVSSTGTFGHTRKPSSLKVSTGGSVERALERGDVTQLVAERHSEAVRLGKIDRVSQKIAKQAGEAIPRRKDDVWVWTDKTVSSKRIPADVRKYLDNPEALQQLPPDRQVSLTEKIKESLFERHDWEADEETRNAFMERAKKGEGVFVPRRLLGELAKTDYAGSTSAVGHSIDVVNNAQKTGLVYLKVNYPIVQALSNTAMNLIQQGPFAVKNLTNSFKLDGKLGPEYSAIIDDIMGQGAIVQAAFEGQGTVARATQKIANVMSSKVDGPARRSSFLHEAAKAGYKTDGELKSLIDEDAKAGDLAEVAQRAKEAIVDYGDLSPFERKFVRKLIFVYPWQKGATKYAGHFLRDHPVQAAALMAVAGVGKRESDKTFGALPTYLEGLIPFGDRSVNPAGVNFFQTPAQIEQAASGLISGSPEQRGAGIGFLAPAPGILAGLLSGHDDIGRPLKSNIGGNIRDLTYGQTPVAAMVRAAASGNSDLVRKTVGSRTSSQSFPDPNDAYLRFLLGGLYARKTSTPALNKNAALQKTGR